MFTIAISAPDAGDITSSFRGMGPLLRLRKQCRNLNLVTMQTWRWDSLGGADILFMQRPYTENHVGIMEIAIQEKIPVWIDYDDLLLDIPTDNPTYFQYMDKKIQANIMKLVSRANVISVSTEHLAKCLKPINKNIVVVQNGIDLKRFGPRPAPKKREKIVMWRGSRTHQRDVFIYAQEIIEASAKHSDWKFHFVGDNMWFATDNMAHERTFVTRPMDQSLYFEHIAKTAPSVMIVPLHASDFNLCKSNIAWLEASYAGAICIAPDWPEWQQPGVLNYSDQVGFKDCLERVIGGQVGIEESVNSSWSHIEKNFELSSLNKIRADVIGSLIGVSIGELGWKDGQNS